MLAGDGALAGGDMIIDMVAEALQNHQSRIRPVGTRPA